MGAVWGKKGVAGRPPALWGRFLVSRRRLGRAAPWSGLDPKERAPRLDAIEQVLASAITAEYDASWKTNRERFLRILHQELSAR